jgi:hypothetical protein
MNVLQKRTITTEIYDYILPLKYKNNYISLLGTGGLQSQLYPSDLDLFCLIESKENLRSVNYNIRKVLYNTSLNSNMYFIEAKNQYKNGEKDKYNKLQDYKLTRPLNDLDYIKLDFVIYIDYNFMELSVIYSFNLVEDMEYFIKQLKDDKKELYDKGMYYKALKRLFALYKLTNTNVNMLVELSKFFNSGVGLIYRMNSRLKAIKLILEHYDNFDVMKKVKVSLLDNGLKDNVDIDKLIKDNDMIINEAGKQYIENNNINILE